MSYWKEISKDLGTVKGGKSIDIQFEALPNIEPVENVIPSCGCMNPIYNKDTKILSIKYHAEPIPLHLVNEESYIVTKHIKILYLNGTTETLSFKLKIIR